MSTDTKHSDMTDAEQTDDQLPLDTAGDVTLPTVKILTGRGFITGKAGSGKSNTASVVIEELLDRGFPCLIVDTDGEYWGLKEEYEILHVGADEECDLQVGPEHAEKLAGLALEENVPIILDVSGFLDEDEADDLVRETARHLFVKEKKLKKPFLLLVEECHEYLPQGGGMNETGEMLVKVAKRGRKHGLGLTGMSQRPADVKKSFITQANWLMWHRLTWENDTKVVRGVVGSEQADAITDLEDGEAFLQADFVNADVQRVQVRRKRTFDAGATPGLDDFERPDLQSVSGDLVEELEEISEAEEQRQDRIAQLEARVEELQDEKEELEEELDSARDMRNLAQQMAEGLQASGGNGDVANEKVDELIDERNELRSTLKDRDNRIEELEATVDDLRNELKQRPEIGERAVEAVEVLAEEFGVGGDDSGALRRKLASARDRINELESERQRTVEPDTNPLENRKVRRFVDGMKERISGLSDTKKAMLRYYVAHGPAEASEAYKYAGNSPTSSRRREYSNHLVDDGLLRKAEGEKYEYALGETVRNELGEHFNDDELRAIREHLEDYVDEEVMEVAAA